jgi:putative efflux protein, MATE family
MLYDSPDEKSKYFTHNMFYRFLIPSLLSSVGLSFGNIADALVVGSKMGETGLAAIGLAAPVFMVYNVFDLGIAIGGSVEYTKLMGEGKAEQGIRSFNQMLYATLFFSILIAVCGFLTLPRLLFVLGTVPADGLLYLATRSYVGILIIAAPLFFLNFLLYFYVRCDDNQRLASIGFVAGNAIDIILNFVLVIGFDMGVKGAILATVIGKTAAIAIYIPHLFLKWTILRVRLLKPEVKLIWNNFRNGFASSSQYLFQFFFFIIINNMLIRIGGERGLAIFDVVINVSYILLSVYDGMGAVIQPLAGTFYGEKNRKAQRMTLSLAFQWGLVLGAATAIITGIFAGPVCEVFGLKAETYGLGVKAVRIYCSGTLIGGISIMMGYYYQAVEKGKLVFLINFLRTFAVYLAFSLFFGTLGIENFWWTFPATEVISFMIWIFVRQYKIRTDYKDKQLSEHRIFCITIHKNEDFGSLLSMVEEFCDKWSAGFARQYFVNLAVEEICQAIIDNGFTNMENGYIEITLIAEEDNTFELHIRDNAVRYNPFDMKTHKICRDNEEGIESIGVFMVKNKAKEFFYRRYQGFNTLTVKV